MITFVALSGFLGAGKTTTMLAAARRLEQRGRAVAVITNDQGTDLVDTRLARSRLDAVAEVTGGCFCCRFEDLERVVATLIERHRPDTIIAESVGSCTDLRATVTRPLRRHYGDTFTVAPMTTVADPLRLRAFTRAWDRSEPDSNLSYLYRQQLDDAELIALNKIDTVGQDQVRDAQDALRRHVSRPPVLPYSAATGQGLDALLDAWMTEPVADDTDLDVDYDRYAAAEAELAWLNRAYDLHPGPGGGLDPAEWARIVLTRISESCARHNVVVGHVKITIDTPAGLVKLSLTDAGAAPTVDATITGPALPATASLNARVACAPTDLDAMAAAAIADADLALGTRTEPRAPSTGAFKPGYPRPTHRINAAQLA